ncbi:MAG: YraN family protein [Deltaproteobacteria bacterium]
MSRERLELGKLGEDLALKTIKQMGYRCITKTRRGKSLEWAKEAVDRRKKRQLSKVALVYMKENHCADVKSRFDVVAVNLGRHGKEIEVVQNAFDLAY